MCVCFTFTFIYKYKYKSYVIGALSESLAADPCGCFCRLFLRAGGTPVGPTAAAADAAADAAAVATIAERFVFWRF